MNNSKYFTSIFCVFALFICAREAVDVSEANVMEDLFNYEYNKEARPATTQQPVVKVSHQLTVNRVISLKDDLLVIDTWQVITWMDPRLAWEKSYYDDLESINLDPKRLWKPDIVNFNNAGGNSGLIYDNLPLVVYHTGQVAYIPPTRLTSQCKPHMDVFYCIWTFGSWSHNIKKMDLNNTHGRLDMSEYEESSRITIVDSSVQRSLKKYQCCPDSYAVVTYNLTIKWKDTDRFRGLEPLQMPKMSSYTTAKIMYQNDEHVESPFEHAEDMITEPNLGNFTEEFLGTEDTDHINGSVKALSGKGQSPPESVEENDKTPVESASESKEEIVTSTEATPDEQTEKHVVDDVKGKENVIPTEHVEGEKKSTENLKENRK